MRRLKRSRVGEKLQNLKAGRVLKDEIDLQKFSRDQSIYEIKPLAVVFPSDLEKLQKVIFFGKEEGIPITPRGGGSGTAGGALGEGIVVVLENNGLFGTIGDFSGSGEDVCVHSGAGVLHGDFQKHLREQGLFLPADVSSAGISQIGGNIATKASGPHALKFGSIDRFTEHVEFFSARGELVNTADPASIPQRFRDGLQDMGNRILKDAGSRSCLEGRQEMKIASGYNLFPFIRDLPLERMLAQLLVGSNGTLGLITGTTLRAVPFADQREVMLLFFDDLQEAGRAICAIRNVGLAAIEIMNRRTVRILQKRTAAGKVLTHDAHVLFIEFSGQGSHEAVEKVRAILESGDYSTLAKPVIGSAEGEIEKFWEARKQILWLIRNPAPHLKALSVVNDVGVPLRHLADFIAEVEQVFENHDLETMIYGHGGSGNLHLRPLFDMTRSDLPEVIQRLTDDVYEVVFRFGGTASAEHGTGRLRVPYLRREWGETLYGFMCELKSLFDPLGLLNPGVMFGEPGITHPLRKDFFEP